MDYLKGKVYSRPIYPHASDGKVPMIEPTTLLVSPRRWVAIKIKYAYAITLRNEILS